MHVDIIMNPQVSSPGLHITLEMFYWLWCLLKGKYHQLDLQLAHHKVLSPADRELFSRYRDMLKELAELERKKPELVQYKEGLSNGLTHLVLHIPSAESNPLLQPLQSEAVSTSTKYV